MKNTQRKLLSGFVMLQSRELFLPKKFWEIFIMQAKAFSRITPWLSNATVKLVNRAT